MHYITGGIAAGGTIYWNRREQRREEEGLTILFSLIGHPTTREANLALAAALMQNNVEWLVLRPSIWTFSSSKFLEYFPDDPPAWLIGEMNPYTEFRHEYRERRVRSVKETMCSFVITPELARSEMPKKIFLSHKSVDKPLVCRFSAALTAIGFEVWLDTDVMPAGIELERGLLKGFEESCAAVFFLTSNFKDEQFLSTEINYAIKEKRKKKDRFSIIALVMEGGEVPALLETYVHKRMEHELTGLVDVIRALPIAVQPPEWRTFDS